MDTGSNKKKTKCRDINKVEDLILGDILEVEIDLIGSRKAIVYATDGKKCSLIFLDAIGELQADSKGSAPFIDKFEETKLNRFLENGLKFLIPSLVDTCYPKLRVPKPEELMEIFMTFGINQHLPKFLEDNTGMWVNGIGKVQGSDELYVLTLNRDIDDFSMASSYRRNKLVPIMVLE